MINRLLYVSCDGCGTAAGGSDDMRETPRVARHGATSIGFARVRVNGKLQDRCPKCVETRRQCSRCARSGGELTENGCPSCGPRAEVRDVVTATKPSVVDQ